MAPWQCDVFEAIATALLVLAKELSELAAAVGAEAVQVTGIGQGQRVRLSARYGDDLFVGERSNLGRVWLIRLLVSVPQQVRSVVETKLAVRCLAPGVDSTVPGQCHRVRVSASQLDHELTLQAVDALRHRHEGTRVYVERHVGDVAEAELTAGAAAKAVDLALV